MHRNALLQSLNEYVSSNPREEGHRREMINFIKKFPRCFERFLPQGHLTASAWLLDSTGKKALLTHHKKLNLWIQPGGHADGNTNLLEASLREAKEESGLTHLQPVLTQPFDLDIHVIPETPKEGAHFHYDVRFLLQNKGSDEFKVSEESHALAWMNLEEIIRSETLEESVKRMARKTLLMKVLHDPIS